MSANLAIDTNVLLLADKSAPCHRISKMVMERPDELCLFLDRDGKIDREYQEYAIKAIEEDPEAVIGLFVAWLSEREKNNKVNRLSPRINGRELFPTECQTSAEAALIGISCGQSNFYLITPDDKHFGHEKIKRCYRDVSFGSKLKEDLKRGGNPLNVLPADAHDKLSELTLPTICCYDQLHAFLSRNRADPESAERAAIELKCPLDQLTSMMIDGMMEALCGMLNSLEGNGYIFCGVRDGNTHSLRIDGIPLKYNDQPKQSWDELKRIVTDRWREFKPRMPNRVDFEVIPDNVSTRGVLMLRVRFDPKDRGYTYKGQRYIRIGERTQKE